MRVLHIAHSCMIFCTFIYYKTKIVRSANLSFFLHIIFFATKTHDCCKSVKLSNFNLHGTIILNFIPYLVLNNILMTSPLWGSKRFLYLHITTFRVLETRIKLSSESGHKKSFVK